MIERGDLFPITSLNVISGEPISIRHLGCTVLSVIDIPTGDVFLVGHLMTVIPSRAVKDYAMARHIKLDRYAIESTLMEPSSGLTRRVKYSISYFIFSTVLVMSTQMRIFS